jgi:glutaredoxin-like protein NrdH
MTKKALDRAGIAYDEVDLTQNPAALEYVTEDLGYSQAPIVQVDDQTHWSGFQPQKISDAASALGRTA